MKKRIDGNAVTGGNAIIWILVLIALVILAFYVGSRYGLMHTAPVTTATTTSATTTTVVEEGSDYYSNPNEWQTYRDNTAGYSIAYPNDFSVDTPTNPASSTDWLMNNVAQAPGLKTFTLTVSASFEPQTNFVDATLTVGYSMNDKALANCLVAENGEATSSTQTIGNATFTVFTSQNAGAGQVYQTTSYRTTHAGACYAVEYTIHSSQLGNYPSSYNLQQFDPQQVSSLFDRIVGTFTFL